MDADITILQGFLNKHEAKLPGSNSCEFKSEGRFFYLFTVYISLDLSTVYLSMFVYMFYLDLHQRVR